MQSVLDRCWKSGAQSPLSSAVSCEVNTVKLWYFGGIPFSKSSLAWLNQAYTPHEVTTTHFDLHVVVSSSFVARYSHHSLSLSHRECRVSVDFLVTRSVLRRNILNSLPHFGIDHLYIKDKKPP